MFLEPISKTVPSRKKRKVLRLHLGRDMWAVTPDRQVPREPVSAGPSPAALHTVLSASQGENASDSKFHPRNLALSQHRGIFFLKLNQRMEPTSAHLCQKMMMIIFCG